MSQQRFSITLIPYVRRDEDIYSLGMIHESNHKFPCKLLGLLIRSINYLTEAHVESRIHISVILSQFQALGIHFTVKLPQPICIILHSELAGCLDK